MKTKAIIGVALALPLMAAAETKTWVAVLDPEGTATTANAAVAENWDPAGIPTAEDDIVLDGERSNVPLVWNVSATGDSAPTSVKSWTQKERYTARVTMPTTRSGAFTQFTVTGDAQLDGGEWWRAGQSKSDGSKILVWLNLKFGGDVSIGPAFTLNGYNAGFGRQCGPSSSGSSDRGASHGGYGGSASYANGTVYGDLKDPQSMGSGGYGDTGDYNGGGAVILLVDGNLVMNGKITADGGDGINSCGPSGGSVNIVAKTLTGTGTIIAEGGSPSGKRHGGGGGRIAIRLMEESLDYAEFQTRFTGTLSAAGGAGPNGDYAHIPGASGTIYIETKADCGSGHLLMRNKSWSFAKGSIAHNAVTPVLSTETWNLASVELRDNARLGVYGTLKVPSFAAITSAGVTKYSLILLAGGSLQSALAHDTLKAEGFGVATSGDNDFSAHNLDIPETSTLKVAGALTVGNLKLNGVKLAKGTYSAAALAETYANVSGEGTIEVLGLEKGLVVVVR